MIAAEGWYEDPFDRHEARWFSDGTPTALVRDGPDEAQDPPPESHYDGPLVEIASDAPTDADDLRRADDGKDSTPPMDAFVAFDEAGPAV